MSKCQQFCKSQCLLSAKANLNAYHELRLEWVERELNPLGTVVFGFTDRCVYLSTLPTHNILYGDQPSLHTRGHLTFTATTIQNFAYKMLDIPFVIT